MSFFDASKSSFDEKIFLKVNARLVNPACHAGVLTSRPHFDARWTLWRVGLSTFPLGLSDAETLENEFRPEIFVGFDQAKSTVHAIHRNLPEVDHA